MLLTSPLPPTADADPDVRLIAEVQGVQYLYVRWVMRQDPLTGALERYCSLDEFPHTEVGLITGLSQTVGLLNQQLRTVEATAQALRAASDMQGELLGEIDAIIKPWWVGGRVDTVQAMATWLANHAVLPLPEHTPMSPHDMDVREAALTAPPEPAPPERKKYTLTPQPSIFCGVPLADSGEPCAEHIASGAALNMHRFRKHKPWAYLNRDLPDGERLTAHQTHPAGAHLVVPATDELPPDDARLAARLAALAVPLPDLPADPTVSDERVMSALGVPEGWACANPACATPTAAQSRNSPALCSPCSRAQNAVPVLV